MGSKTVEQENSDRKKKRGGSMHKRAGSHKDSPPLSANRPWSVASDRSGASSSFASVRSHEEIVLDYNQQGELKELVATLKRAAMRVERDTGKKVRYPNTTNLSLTLS